MGEWLPASGRRINSDAPSYEVYFNTPMTVPKSDLRTEIRIPVLGREVDVSREFVSPTGRPRP